MYVCMYVCIWLSGRPRQHGSSCVAASHQLLTLIPVPLQPLLPLPRQRLACIGSCLGCFSHRSPHGWGVKAFTHAATQCFLVTLTRALLYAGV